MTGPVLATHHDTIPNFAYVPTIRSVGFGFWSAPETWNLGRLPNASDIVLIESHAVVYDVLDGDVDTIGIQDGGTLRLADDYSTRLKFVNMLVMEGGALVSSPSAGMTAEFIVKDRAPNTAVDPSQYGTGIIVVDGTIIMHGAEKTAFVRCQGELRAGDSLGITGELPVAWPSGDLLLVPDTRETRTTPTQWDIVTRDQPLKFSCLGSRNLDGTICDLPHVANLTRNIIIRSENPNGTRGHVLLAGKPTVDIRYVLFKDMGRTKATPLDSTTATHIGTNQIGRYPLHVHHIEGAFTLIGNVIDGSPKWGIAIHDSHYGLVDANVVYNCIGAGIVMEDGSETGNRVSNNFVARCDGHPDGLTAREKSGIGVDTGYEGSCFWMRGQRNDYRGNVACGARAAGFMIFERMGHVGKTFYRNIPMFDGADQHEQFQVMDVRQSVPFAFDDNEAYACGRGFEFWYAWVSVMTNSRTWHIGSRHLFFTYHGTAVVDGFRARGDDRDADGIVGQHGTHLILRHANVQKTLSPFRVEPHKKKGIILDDVAFDGVQLPDVPAPEPTIGILPWPESSSVGVVTLQAAVPAGAGKVEIAVDGKILKPVKAAPRTVIWDTTKFANGPHWVSASFNDVAFASQRMFVNN